MGQVLHGSATTTEAVRRAIQHSQASLRALSKRYGINQKTVANLRIYDPSHGLEKAGAIEDALRTAIAQADAHAALRQAALAQVMAARAAEQAPVLPSITTPVIEQPAARTDAQSPFAGMGIVDDTEIAPTDVTAILSRRRVAS